MNRKLNLANALTVGRLVLAPGFILAYAFVDVWTSGADPRPFLTAMWILYLVMELTDVLDGVVARRQQMVTDLGKVLDPFADVVCRLTYFTVLTVAEIMPLWFLMIVMYRELASVFLRLLFYKDGFALGAGIPGKLKSWFYSLSATAGLILLSAARLPGFGRRIDVALPAISIAATVIFGVAAALSIWSILGYVIQYIRRLRGTLS